MTNKESTKYDQLSIDQPAQYRIRIRGKLDEHMSDRLSGMRISHQTQEDGPIVSTLEGQLVDQAALFGVLVSLYNMRLPLISVECTENDKNEGDSLIKVRVEQKTDYLEFIVSGVQSVLPIPEPLETVLNSCELAGLYRVLVDFRGLEGGDEENPEIEYAQGVGQGYQDYLDAGGTPIKAVVVGKEEMIRAWKQSEEIAQGYSLKTFVSNDYEEAVAWLRSEKVDQ